MSEGVHVMILIFAVVEQVYRVLRSAKDLDCLSPYASGLAGAELSGRARFGRPERQTC